MQSLRLSFCFLGGGDLNECDGGLGGMTTSRGNFSNKKDSQKDHIIPCVRESLTNCSETRGILEAVYQYSDRIAWR